MAPSEPAALAGATILFDLDGTLVDTAPDIVRLLNQLLDEEGLPRLPFEEARNLIGGGARPLIERGFRRAGAELSEARLGELVERFFPIYAAQIADESRPFPGVARALIRLQEAGAILAVCTNKRTELSRLLLEKLDLARFFTAILGPDASGARKPDPRPLHATLAAAGGDLTRSLLVGDSGLDAGAARAAGIPLILVSFGYTETPAAELSPDILIDHFDELPDACLRLLTACGA